MPHALSPVGVGTLVIIAALLAITLGWTIGVLPRHRPSGPARAIAQQALAVLLSILLSLVMVAGLLNRDNDWYPSWPSLLGMNQRPTVTTDGAHSGTSAGPVQPVAWDTGDVTAVQANPRQNPALGGPSWQDPAPHGQYLQLSITGATTGYASPTVIWLPPSYLAHPERHYPVIVALQGLPGEPSVFQHALPMGRFISTAVGQEQMREAIVVAPTVFPNNQDTECVDSADGSLRIDTFLSTDLVTWIKTNLRSVDDPAGWATLGFSAGGWCSSMLAMRHPDTFGSSINMSGYFQPRYDGPSLRPADDPAYDLPTIARDQAPAVRLWFYVAKDDTVPYRSVQQFRTAVRPPTSLTTALVETGGHGFGVWSAGASAGLEWLGAGSPQFAWVAS